MGCKSDLSPIGIPVHQMRDGQMAVIIQWDGDTCTVGKVVQRYIDCLVVLGEYSGHSFDQICKSSGNEKHRVQLLNDGDVIQIDEIVAK